MPPLRNPHSRYAHRRRRRRTIIPRPEEVILRLNEGEVPNRSRGDLEFMENQGENYLGFGKSKLETVLKIISYLKTIR
jgi:hypothetical protein